MTNEVKELLEDTKCVIHDVLEEEWGKEVEQWDGFEYENESEAYGDTYVRSGSYITDESDTDFRENFKQNHDVDTFIDLLKANPDFRNCIQELVKEYADTRDYDI